jgi:hypothetical protein
MTATATIGPARSNEDIHAAIDRTCVERYRELIFSDEFDPWTRAAYAASVLRKAAGAPEVNVVPDEEIQAAATILGLETPVREICRRCGGQVCEVSP